MSRCLLTLLAAAALLPGCAIVRQQDLDAWVGVPVEALDTHSFFITVPMRKSITSTGMEVRNYANGQDQENCVYNKFAGIVCVKDSVVCNNIFYIRDGRVVEYAPTGRCMTAATLQPEARWRSMVK